MARVTIKQLQEKIVELETQLAAANKLAKDNADNNDSHSAQQPIETPSTHSSLLQVARIVAMNENCTTRIFKGRVQKHIDGDWHWA